MAATDLRSVAPKTCSLIIILSTDARNCFPTLGGNSLWSCLQGDEILLPTHLKTRQVVTWPLPETAQSPALQHKKGPYGKTANKGAVTSGIVLLSPHGEKVSIKQKNSTSGK